MQIPEWNGSKLKQLSQNIKISDIANCIGVSRQQVHCWINGQAPRGNDLIMLADYFEIKPHAFFEISKAKKIDSEMFGDKWPLKIDRGFIKKLPSGAIVFSARRNTGATYAVNGIAESLGFESMEFIWKDNPDIPGTKMNISCLIEFGGKL